MSETVDPRSIAQQYLKTYPNSQCYLLLDGAGLPGLSRQLNKFKICWASLFDGKSEENARLVGPILAEVGRDGKLLFPSVLSNWLGEKDALTSSISILLSPLRLEDLVMRLAIRLEVTLTEGMSALLRFYDPRVLESLSIILNAEQADDFFSVANDWLYVNRVGKINALPCIFKPLEKFVNPLLLNQEQEFAMVQASEIDQVKSLLRKTLPSLTTKKFASNYHEFVSRMLSEAKQKGIASVLDLATYTAIILSEGEDYADSREWKKFIDGWDRNASTFCDYASTYHSEDGA